MQSCSSHHECLERFGDKMHFFTHVNNNKSQELFSFRTKNEEKNDCSHDIHTVHYKDFLKGKVLQYIQF